MTKYLINAQLSQLNFFNLLQLTLLQIDLGSTHQQKEQSHRDKLVVALAVHTERKLEII